MILFGVLAFAGIRMQVACCIESVLAWSSATGLGVHVHYSHCGTVSAVGAGRR